MPRRFTCGWADTGNAEDCDDNSHYEDGEHLTMPPRPERKGHRATNKAERENRRTCVKCGRLGHLSTTCEQAVDKAHAKVGIEIEGYWKDLPSAQVKALEICESAGGFDGSLASDVLCESRCRRSDCAVCGCRGWEFQTAPGSLGEALRQLTALYPDVVGDECGLHMHMSFTEPGSITALACDEFSTYFRTRMRAWADKVKLHADSPFWGRLEGTNTYCRVNALRGDYNHHGSLVDKSGTERFPNSIAEPQTRYRQINFASWSKHKTLEFRLLPMFRDQKLAVSALEEIVDIVESWLAEDRIATAITELPESPVVVAPVLTLAPVEREVQPLDPALAKAVTHVVREVDAVVPPPGTLVNDRDFGIKYLRTASGKIYAIRPIAKAVAGVLLDRAFDEDR